MESDKLLENLFDKKILSIIKVFLNRKGQQLTLQEIAKFSKVPLASTFRIMQKLTALELIAIMQIKHLKTYVLIENDRTKFLENALKGTKTFMDEFLETLSNMPTIRRVILHGREEKDKANVLIIGDSVDDPAVREAVREAVVNAKVKHNFTITHLLLTEGQYTQMAAMNLYSGKKEILLER